MSAQGGSASGGKKNVIEAGAGVDLPKLVEAAIDNSLKGLEWAAGIPGTFGGALRGNAGAFGGEIKDKVVSIRFLDDTGDVRTFSNKECEFSYRDSIFKQNPNYIILSATVRLEKGDRAALKKFAKDTIAYRASRHPLEYGSCGSVFKAVDVNDIRLSNFVEYPRFRESIKTDPFPVIPAACFIDEAGLKGYRVGGSMVSRKHPNFFVNFDRARAEDVMILISLARQRLVHTFGITVEEEVQYVGY
jgi:UDP-N-acetylmuramate dehydrogenase